MAGLSDRERKMGVAVIAIIVVFGHVFGSKKLVDAFNAKKAELAKLEQEARVLVEGGDTEGILEDKQWLAEHEPEPQTYEDVQTELQKFLETSCTQSGLTPFGVELKKDIDAELGLFGNYRRVRIQISAKGDQQQIVQWLVKIHQPENFRALTYLKLEADKKEEGVVVCHIIADQWLVPEF
ncbi:hypothetical protein Rhal01_03061 [Rubritalea halochordaticola]|uniref:General secretion pathway protein GspM n=1 Tax=Rubritalea halochordaticola TaxID=714537 RepID=A0ABP9V2V4_9BACT